MCLSKLIPSFNGVAITHGLLTNVYIYLHVNIVGH